MTEAVGSLATRSIKAHSMDDVIVVGGSFAGLAAALYLGRARRQVTVLDTALPRNRFASYSHGVLGHDHKQPSDILAEARRQLARYPTIRLVDARAEHVSGGIDDFLVITDAGESLRSRRIILSYGVVDWMPDVAGFAESWGTSIVPCPYCDGYEVADTHWGVLWAGPMSLNQVRLFRDWTDTMTVFADGHDLSPKVLADLDRRRVPVVDGRIVEIVAVGAHGASIRLDTGEEVAIDVLFAQPRNAPSARIHEALGLATVATPTGVAIKVDDRGETSVQGIYAAGDLANPGMPSVTRSMSLGATAGISAQQSMLV